jgi:hypothetical protein
MALSRSHWLVLLLIAGSIATAGAVGYRQWPELKKRFSHQPTNLVSTEESSSTVPPFPTKEPARYRAIRVITESAETGGSGVITERTLIARDGDNRREERNLDRPQQTIYIESAAGRFLLLPARKIYVSLSSTSERLTDASDDDLADAFSPDRLLHESAETTHYQSAGTEMIGERKTSKYLVTIGEGGAETQMSSVIWVDEELGMPIKSETREQARIATMELTDIHREVDAHLFEVPGDYNAVDFATFQIELRRLSGNSSKAPRNSNDQ